MMISNEFMLIIFQTWLIHPSMIVVSQVDNLNKTQMKIRISMCAQMLGKKRLSLLSIHLMQLPLTAQNNK